MMRGVSEALETLAPNSAGVVCGFSGGADSALLLTVLSEWCGARCIPLTALHVHHGIRGDEADRDAAFCGDFCAERGIPFALLYADAPALAAERGISLEAAAREARYACFARFCRENGADRVALAHHADDQAETVLFKLIRGSGLRGLCGIAPDRVVNGVRVIRPLLHMTKAEILAACDARAIPFVTDSTNADPSYSRNFLRERVTPLCRTLNPAFSADVACMTAALRRDEMLLSRLAEQTPYPAEEDALLIRQLMTRYEAVSEGRMAQRVQLEQAMSLLRGGKMWRMVDFPGGIVFQKTPDGGCFMRKRDASADVQGQNFSMALREGENPLPGGGKMVLLRLHTGKEINECKNIYRFFIHKLLKSDKMKGRLFVRFRREGDEIRSGGMTKKVKKLLGSAGIPPDERQALPFLCDEDGIVWIPGVAMRDGVGTEHAAEADTALLYINKEGNSAAAESE